LLDFKFFVSFDFSTKNLSNEFFYLDQLKKDPLYYGVSIDDCKAQLAANILKLSTQDRLNVTDVLFIVHFLDLLGMIEQYGTLSCEKTSFLQTLITTISAISGPIRMQNPIGEPGWVKITLLIEKKFSSEREIKTTVLFSECPYAFVLKIVIRDALLPLKFHFLNGCSSELSKTKFY
jgi:hypothetical protein